MTPTRDDARQGPGGARAVSQSVAGSSLPHLTPSADPAQIIIHCDGLCEPRNPGGWACWAWLATDPAGQILASDRGCIGHGQGMTNNLAEYTAAMKALEWAAGAGLVGLTLRTDSQLVAYQVAGAWECRAANLWPLLAQVLALVATTRAQVEWVPRAQNESADALTRQAYAAATKGGRP